MDPDRLERLERLANRLDRSLRDVLVVVAVLFFVGVILLLFTMGGPTYGGRLCVAIAATVVLGWLDGQYDQLERRRLALLEGAAERAVWRRMRFRLGFLAAAASVLMTIALILG